MSHHCQLKTSASRRIGRGRLALITALLMFAVACAPPAIGAGPPPSEQREQTIAADPPDANLAPIALESVDAPAHGHGGPTDLDHIIDQSGTDEVSSVRAELVGLAVAATEATGGSSTEAGGPADSIPAPGQSPASCDQ